VCGCCRLSWSCCMGGCGSSRSEECEIACCPRSDSTMCLCGAKEGPPENSDLATDVIEALSSKVASTMHGAGQ